MERGMTMKDSKLVQDVTSFNWFQLLIYTLAGVSGGTGACAVAAQRLIHGEKITIIVLLSYAILGVFSGLFFYAYMTVFQNVELTIQHAILYGGGWGVISILILSMTYGGLRIVARRFGWDFEINAYRTKDRSDNVSETKP
jgi:hypothetical protein